MKNVTLLTKEQVENSDLLHNFNLSAPTTDLYILQKGYVDQYKRGEYWTQTKRPEHVDGVFRVIHNDTLNGHYSANNRLPGIRPIMPLSEILKENPKVNVEYGGIETLEYGEYPQNIVDESLEEELETLYQQKKLNKTNKKYTHMLKNKNEKYQEYEYKENKYIRIEKANVYDRIYKNYNKELINRKTYWLEVKPLEWVIDRDQEIAISKYIISSMLFSRDNDNNYENSDIKKYLENNFLKEIQQGKNVDAEKIDDLIDLMNKIYDTKEEKPKQKVR